jgi:hypothetical protein
MCLAHGVMWLNVLVLVNIILKLLNAPQGFGIVQYFVLA